MLMLNNYGNVQSGDDREREAQEWKQKVDELEKQYKAELTAAADDEEKKNEIIKQIAEDNITDILEQADGVAEAAVRGGRTKQVNVELDQNRLAAYGFTIPTVVSALAKQNLELGGGKVQEGHKNYVVRTTGQFSSIDEINDTVISTINGYTVKLRDIGTATMGYADASSESYINGERGVYITITKVSGSKFRADTASVPITNSTRKTTTMTGSRVRSKIPNGITFSRSAQRHRILLKALSSLSVSERTHLNSTTATTKDSRNFQVILT